MSSKVIKWFKRQASIRRFTEKSEKSDEKTSSSKNSSDDKKKTGFARLSFRKRNKKKTCAATTDLEGTPAIVGISKKLSYSVPKEMERGTKDLPTVSVPTTSISLENSSYTCSPSKSELSWRSLNDTELTKEELSKGNLTDNETKDTKKSKSEDCITEMDETVENKDNQTFQSENKNNFRPNLRTSNDRCSYSKDNGCIISERNYENAPLAKMEEICAISSDKEYPEEIEPSEECVAVHTNKDPQSTEGGLCANSGEVCVPKDMEPERVSTDIKYSLNSANENSVIGEKKESPNSENTDSANSETTDSVNREMKDVTNTKLNKTSQKETYLQGNEGCAPEVASQTNIFEEIDKLLKGAQEMTDIDVEENGNEVIETQFQNNETQFKNTDKTLKDEQIPNSGSQQSDLSEYTIKHIPENTPRDENAKFKDSKLPNEDKKTIFFNENCDIKPTFNKNSVNYVDIYENICEKGDENKREKGDENKREKDDENKREKGGENKREKDDENKCEKGVKNDEKENQNVIDDINCSQPKKYVEIVVTHPSPDAKPKPKSKSSQCSYPEELNPFGEEESETEDKMSYDGNANLQLNTNTKVSSTDATATTVNGTNPFGDEDELHKEYSLLRKTKTKYYLSTAAENALFTKTFQTGSDSKSSLNPFDESSDDVTTQQLNSSNPFDEEDDNNDDEERTKVNTDDAPPCLPPKSEIQKRKNSGSLAPIPRPRRSKQLHHGSSTSLQNDLSFPIPAPRSITPFGSTKTVNFPYTGNPGEEDEDSCFERQGLGRNSIQIGSTTSGLDYFSRQHPIRGSLPPSMIFRSGRKKRQAPLPPGLAPTQPSTSGLSASSTTFSSGNNCDLTFPRSNNRASSSPPSVLEASERKPSTCRAISPGRLAPPRPPLPKNN